MAEALASHSEGHFITMHSGMLDPEPFAALAAGNPRVLLDFSMSLTKYPDQMRERIIEIASRMPDSVALGSDGPEWTYAQVRASFDDIAVDLSKGTAEGFAAVNLYTWLAAI